MPSYPGLRTTPEPIVDTYSGFEECFRFLVGTGVHVMMTRGIARMVSLSAKKLGLRFPEPIERTIETLAGLMWRPEDVGLLNSSYPNRTPGLRVEEGEESMEGLLRRWQEVEIVGEG
ncbi:hypothetical protein PRZ48_013627 [Zasmidium cellare]|uniref:Uncharacterized protein n=1 Tax=Zasmidium cellare TaxID=395010 RepID=A0ABR0E1L5_ZASCE|nr:hypothetical protein PRZ48_013627 [Zasmidium cellare]